MVFKIYSLVFWIFIPFLSLAKPIFSISLILPKYMLFPNEHLPLFAFDVCTYMPPVMQLFCPTRRAVAVACGGYFFSYVEDESCCLRLLLFHFGDSSCETFYIDSCGAFLSPRAACPAALQGLGSYLCLRRLLPFGGFTYCGCGACFSAHAAEAPTFSLPAATFSPTRRAVTFLLPGQKTNEKTPRRDKAIAWFCFVHGLTWMFWIFTFHAELVVSTPVVQ